MIKSIVKIGSVLIVGVAIGMVISSFTGGFAGQGISHLSGLAVGADGLSTENGGTAVFGTSASVGTTLSVGATTTASGQITADGGYLGSKTNSTSTTATTYTAVEADLFPYSSIILTPNTNSITVTLPASTTLSNLVPAVGDVRDIIVVNGTSTAAKTITIAAGTGTLLKNASTTAAIGPKAMAILKFVRTTDTDVLVYMNSGI